MTGGGQDAFLGASLNRKNLWRMGQKRRLLLRACAMEVTSTTLICQTPTRFWRLFCLPNAFFLVSLLQNVERLLFLALIRYQTLAIEAILNARKLSTGRVEIHQNPRTHPAQLRNAAQHLKLILEDACLIFFGPALGFRPVQAGLGVAAKFTDDERLIVGDLPLSSIGPIWVLLIPADVLVCSNDVESFAQRVIDILYVPFGTNKKRRRHQPCRIEHSDIAC